MRSEFGNRLRKRPNMVACRVASRRVASRRVASRRVVFCAARIGKWPFVLGRTGQGGLAADLIQRRRMDLVDLRLRRLCHFPLRCDVQSKIGEEGGRDHSNTR